MSKFCESWRGWGLLICFSLSACLSTKVDYEIPPSPHILTGVSQLHVDQFSGQDGEFFKNMLIQEIQKIPNFEYRFTHPPVTAEAAVISGEVLVYSKRDEPQTRPKAQTSLIQRDVMQRSDQSSERLRQRAFDFVEVPYEERAIHRTLDLDIRFTIGSPQTGQILHKNVEKISFQQSYIGEESIQLMPLADDEMERLGRQLIRRFLDKINPALPKKTLELETGSVEVPGTFGSMEVGHPGILNGNRYAVAGHYERALQLWSYVIFAPQVFAKSERFIFNDEAYTKLKSSLISQVVLKILLEWHGDQLTLEALDKRLAEKLSRTQYTNYAQIVKAHTRTSKTQENLNLAAAHYNSGSIYRIQNQLALAAYHFAQANAFRPHEKYAQAWTDTQREMGDFNPLDLLMDRTIEAASQQQPPPNARVKPAKFAPKLAPLRESEPVNDSASGLQPVELPMLLQEEAPPVANPNAPPATPREEGVLDLK